MSNTIERARGNIKVELLVLWSGDAGKEKTNFKEVVSNGYQI